MELAWRCNSVEAGLGARVRVLGHKVGPGGPLLSLCSSPVLFFSVFPKQRTAPDDWGTGGF